MEESTLTLLPRFPIELERQIFEICACWYPISIPKLILVAWRVKEWVEPLLYRTIVLSNITPIAGYPSAAAPIKSLLCSKPTSFLRTHVRNVHLGEADELTRKLILSECTGIENLWTRQHPNDAVIQLLAALSPRHLYAIIHPLLDTLSPSHSFFSKMTHLQLIGDAWNPAPNHMGNWSGLSLIPQLTHLSFIDPVFITICRPLLHSCKLLALLVCLDTFEGDQQSRADERIQAEGLQQDLRFVAMRCEYFHKDWQMGVYTGSDYWTRAEDLSQNGARVR
ncbi:hypothetical protein C8R43DRAFT_153863 [Mycena crocata]|nr:hypothetical protein C8R43DRAFT_153863 [Mycena crocata]